MDALHLGHSCLLGGSVYLCQQTPVHQVNFSHGIKKTPNQPQQKQSNKKKKGLWDMPILGFPAWRSSWSATAFGGSTLSNLQVPRFPKAQPLACPSKSTTSLHLLDVRGKGWPYSCWQKILQLPMKPKHGQGASSVLPIQQDQLFIHCSPTP